MGVFGRAVNLQVGLGWPERFPVIASIQRVRLSSSYKRYRSLLIVRRFELASARCLRQFFPSHKCIDKSLPGRGSSCLQTKSAKKLKKKYFEDFYQHFGRKTGLTRHLVTVDETREA